MLPDPSSAAPVPVLAIAYDAPALADLIRSTLGALLGVTPEAAVSKSDVLPTQSLGSDGAVTPSKLSYLSVAKDHLALVVSAADSPSAASGPPLGIARLATAVVLGSVPVALVARTPTL